MDICSHWGEIEENDEIGKSLNQEENNSNYKWNYFEVPSLYQPCKSHKNTRKELSKHQLTWVKPPLDSKGQNHLLQSIELQHYKRRMRYMLSAAHSHHTDVQKATNESTVLPSPPLPPKRFCSGGGNLVSSAAPSFLSTEYTATKKIVENKINSCPELTTLSVRQLLLKSVAAVVSHTGFECASESSLSTFTDIAAEHFTKLCCIFKRHLEKAPPDSNPIDVFSAVIRENNFDDLSALQEYWLKRVKNVALKFENEDLTLLDEYNSLKESSSNKLTPAVTIKEEVK